ncbi:VOC family protein [Spirosoma aureum]|uniref:VOC family protein n=1 Tax=Spirosoma aureum TaxID=2692134 RepID=A0A6G9AL72_9BACT|nr:VOC family protein [Spirosoma aureum]QIP13197.1 VOC family protein [Spirosoma aureum]
MADMVFSHIALSCADPARTEQYYSDHFGFRRGRVIPLGGDNEIVFLKNDQSVYLELFRADAENPGVPVAINDGPHYAGIRHLAFQVSDVDATVKAMGSAAEITLGPLDFSDFIPGWKTIWLKDPDGNIVEISQGYTDQTA